MIRPAAGKPARLVSSQPWVQGLALVALVAICYLPALRAGYVMDDDSYVTDNQTLRSLDGLRQIWFEPNSRPQYYPLMNTTLWAGYQLWGADPLGYHVVNIVLQMCTVLLAWKILLRLQARGAWLAAALFAVHPVCVESVAWVTKLMNVQSMLLALGAMWCYLRFDPPEPKRGGSGKDGRRWGYYWRSLALFVAALLSKTVAGGLWIVLLVVYWWKRGRLKWNEIWPLAPFFALYVGFGTATAWIERHFAGAEGAEWNFSLVERTLIAGRAFWFYLSKLVWPFPVVFYYPRWKIDSTAWWQYLYPAAVVALLFTLWLLRNRIGRAPVAAAAIYLGVLSPALGFFNVYAFRFSFVADRYQYHAMLAPIALAAAGVAIAYDRVAANRRRVVAVGVLAVLALFGMLSFDQARAYHDPQTLYQDVLAKNPDSWAAYANLAADMAQRGNRVDAIAMFRKALELNPGDTKTSVDLAGLVVESGGSPQQLVDVTDLLRQALERAPQNIDVLTQLVQLLMRQNKIDDSQQYFERAAAIDRAKALGAMGAAFCAANKWEDAKPYLEESVQLNSSSPQAQQALGNVYNQIGKPELAVPCYQRAAELRPLYFEAWSNLGATLLMLGKPAEAIPYIQRAIVLRPGDATAKANLQEALEMRRSNGK